MEAKDIVTVQTHNAISGLIIENTNIKKNNKFVELDGMWSSV